MNENNVSNNEANMNNNDDNWISNDLLKCIENESIPSSSNECNNTTLKTITTQLQFAA